MRTFSSGFQTKLESGSFAPILLVDYELKEYISGDEPNTGTSVTTNYYWAERTTTYNSNSYEPRLVNTAPLNMELDASRQVFSEMSLQVANNVDQLISVIQAGMKATVRLGFQESDGSVTEAEILFIGTVEGDIEITEDSVSFNLQDIAFSYDRQIPNIIDEINFVGAGREDVGNPIPLVAGRAKNHLCRSVTGQFTTSVAQNSIVDYEEEYVLSQWSDIGTFVQTPESLLSQSSGGYWYTSWNTAYGSLNASVTTEKEYFSGADATIGQGLTITPTPEASTAPGGYRLKQFYLNPISASLDLEDGEYYQILVRVDNWVSGWVQVVGHFEDYQGTALDGEVFKQRRFGNLSSFAEWTFKASSGGSHPQFGLLCSYDFSGTIRLQRISKINYDASRNYIYVSDDIGHWYKKHLVADDNNDLSLDLSVGIDYVVPNGGTQLLPGASEGTTVTQTYTVTDIEHDVDGYSYEVFDGIGGSDITVTANTITVQGVSQEDFESVFQVGKYVYAPNGVISDVPVSSNVERDGGLQIAEEISDFVLITEVDGANRIATVDGTLDPNKVEVLNELLAVTFLDDTIQLSSGVWLDYGVTDGMSITISGTSYDGTYTVLSVIGDTITVTGSFAPFPDFGVGTFTSYVDLYEIELVEVLTVRYAPRNLWKMTFAEPILFEYEQGNTITAITEQDEVFVIADHAVQRISNVRVNGIPLPSDAGHVVETSSTSYANDGAERSYIKIPFDKLANIASLALNVDDSNRIYDDNQSTQDDIIVDDGGHDHQIGAERTYNWAVNIQFSGFTVPSGTDFRITIQSGSYTRTVYDLAGGTTVFNNPVRFTSNSPDCRVNFIHNFYLSYRIVEFERVDSLTGDTVYDYQSASGQTSRTFTSNMTLPADTSATGEAPANVVKIGTAFRQGDFADYGYLLFNSPVALSQVRSNLVITCDVIGNVDGSDGYKMPHEQIKSLINRFATNPINGTEGNADIVEFVNEAEMIAYFSKVWNTYLSEETATDVWPKMKQLINTNTDSATNKSPNAELSNSLIPVATEDTVSADFRAYNEKGIHTLDFALNDKNQLRDLIGEMLLQSNMVCVWRNGIAYLKLLTETPTNNGTLDSSDMVMKSISLRRSPVSELATDITVLFDYGRGGYNRAYHYAKQSWSNGVLTEIPLDATRKFGSYDRDKYFELPLVREQVAAELLADRFYQEYSDAKFHAKFTTTLANLAYEPTDNLTVSIPIHRDSMMDRGLVTRKVINFGSAIDRTPDLIDFEVRENHTTSGYYLSLYL